MTDSGPLLETLKSMILDFQEMELQTGVPRRLRIETVPGKATVCIGVRRSGKSTYLYQLIARLLEQGVPRRNVLYLNFFDDRLHCLRHGDLGLITDAYFSLYPEKKDVETVHCFFDEIQAAPGWEPFVDRLLRTERCQVHLTGSSAQLLSREIATQMRGRALSWEIFPFSFREYLDYRGIDGAKASCRPSGASRSSRHSTSTGSGEVFPRSPVLGRDLRIRIHQEYFSTILFRDLVERHDVSHPRAVSDSGPPAGGRRRIALHRQQPHGLSQVARPQGAEGVGVGVPGVVRGRLFPVHRAHLRRVGGAQERQSEDRCTASITP